MQKRRTRFPRRWAQRVVEEIMAAAIQLDPGDPFFYAKGDIPLTRYNRLVARSADLTHIVMECQYLLDAIRTLR